MKKLSLVLIAALVAFSMTSCNAYSKAESAYKVVSVVISLAQADLPALQATGLFSPAEGTAVSGYLASVSILNDQYGTCVANAQNTKLANSGKFLACANIFSAGLLDPKQLAGLRILNPKAQHQVQLWVSAVQIGLNTAVVALGGAAEPAPAVGPAPTTAELHSFEQRVRGGL